MPTKSSHARILIYGHPRSACHLLFKMLSGTSAHHKRSEEDGLIFLDAYTSGVDRQNSYPPDEVIATIRHGDQITASYQACLDEAQANVRKDEERGEIPVLLEHTHMLMSSSTLNRYIRAGIPRATRNPPVVVDRMHDLSFDQAIIYQGQQFAQTVYDRAVGMIAQFLYGQEKSSFTFRETQRIPNPTVLPTRFIDSFTPVITIRHPALMIPSLIRGREKVQGTPKLDSEFAPIATFKWERLMFEYYQTTFDVTPIVIDGGKLVRDPHGTMERFCRRCEEWGLNAHNVRGMIRYEWSPNLEPARDLFWETFTGELRRSTGIQATKSTCETLDLSEEKAKWVKEWGNVLADEIEVWVEEAMEHYTFLFQESI